jgi:5-methyltetrahydrofolate--homocysteine methyltransferase
MINKDNNLEKYKERCLAFWYREYVERCTIAIYAPAGPDYKNINKFLDKIEMPGNFKTFWTDSEYIVENNTRRFHSTYFIGEAVPNLFINLGPGVTASYLGCTPHFTQDTVWFEQFINDWEKDDYDFDEYNCMWEKTCEITQLAVSKSAGEKYFVSLTDLSGVIDVMAHMRGVQNLCFDMVEKPEVVKKARDKILEDWFRCLTALYNMTRENNKGCMNRHGIWAPDLYYPLQCDFSALISPKMFEEFVLPEIQEECKRMKYAEYHLDGQDALKHLDCLLSIPELDAIQWQPGVNGGPMVKWIPLLKKIQKAGKSIVLVDIEPDEVETIVDELSPNGMFISTKCQSKEEALDLLRVVEAIGTRSG